MKKSNYLLPVLLGAFIASVSNSALAQSRVFEEPDGEWGFSLAPLFLWGMSIDGDATLDGNTADLDLDFSDDILENMEAVFTLHFEARKDDLVLFAEYQYVNLTPDVGGGVGPVSVDADIDFTVQSAEFGAGYVFSRSSTVLWEVLGGVRWNDHDIDVDVEVTTPGPRPIEAEIGGGDDWIHPFVGGRVFSRFANNWTMVLRADVGYSGSDDSALNLVAMVDYRLSDWGSVFGGYRYMDFDYEASSYAYDAIQQGPLLGLNFYW